MFNKKRTKVLLFLLNEINKFNNGNTKLTQLRIFSNPKFKYYTAVKGSIIRQIFNRRNSLEEGGNNLGSNVLLTCRGELAYDLEEQKLESSITIRF